MQFGTQFTGTLTANQTVNFFTFGWQAAWNVSWMIFPTTAGPAAQIQWTVSTQLSGATITYWIQVKNLTAASVNIQGRYAILNA
jgi:hypothetical protein